MNNTQESIIVSVDEQEIQPHRRAWKWLVLAVLMVVILLGVLSYFSPTHDKQAYKQHFTKAKQAITQQQHAAQQRKNIMAQQVKNSKHTDNIIPPKAAIKHTVPEKADAPITHGKKPALIAEKKQQTDSILALQAQLTEKQRIIETLKKKNAQLMRQRTRTQQFIAQQRMLWEGYAEMHTQIEAGKPFLRVIGRLQSIKNVPFAVQEAIARLRPYAKKGGVQYDEVTAAFADAFTRYYAAYPLHGIGGGSPEHGFSRWLGGLVQVQKVGAQHEGTDDAARLARAEVNMQHHQLERALREVQSVSVKATPFFKTWRTQSYNYLEVRRALRALKQLLFMQSSQAFIKE